MADRGSRLSPATRAAQALGRVAPASGAIVPPIELASTFARAGDYAPRAAYTYARDGGPTVEHAEAVIADLDAAERSFLFASGMAALAALTETLSTGDRVTIPERMYYGCLKWLRRIEARRGIALDRFDPAAPVPAALPEGTRLVWIETPVNPTWEVIDISAAATAARAAGAILAVDCTAAPPCTQRALELGADIAFHSATKYLAGHSDLTAGVLSLARTGPLADDLLEVRTLMGSVLGAFEAWLLIRGLRTLFLRYERASESALSIAEHLRGHSRVASVSYPGLPDHPGHGIAARQMTGGFGGMLSFEVAGTEAEAVAVATRTRLFLPATSLGGVESLIEHRRTIEGRHSDIPGTLLRLSVGIEDAGDLIADLDAALDGAECGA